LVAPRSFGSIVAYGRRGRQRNPFVCGPRGRRPLAVRMLPHAVAVVRHWGGKDEPADPAGSEAGHPDREAEAQTFG